MTNQEFFAQRDTMVRDCDYDMFRKATAATEEFKHAVAFDNQTERTMLEAEYSALLQQAVKRLPDIQKTIFHMAKDEGLSHQVIATELGLHPMTVKAYMKKALRTIRLHLEPHLGTGAIVLMAVLGL